MKQDIGLTWAKGLNIWGQFTTILSVIQASMIVVMFYVTTVNPNTHISWWIYALSLATIVGLVVAFIIKWGISGYYRFFNQQTAVADVERMAIKNEKRILKLMKHLGVADVDD